MASKRSSPSATSDSVEPTRSVNINVTVPAPARTMTDLQSAAHDWGTIKPVCELSKSGCRQVGTSVRGTSEVAQAQRRKNVMDAALGLAARGGVQGLRIRDVVARTGVSSATIYRY